MEFRNECNRFLDTISSMRSSAINKAVDEAIANEHEPYVVEMSNACDALIAEETQKTADIIRNLQADLERKVEHYKTQKDNAIADHKVRVVATASEKAKVEYDTFILGVSKLIDETKI